MVSHASLYILYAHLLVRNHPEWHILSIRILAECPRQITAHILEVVEQSPSTGIAEAATREIRFGISHLPGEVSILAAEPALAAREGYHVLGKHDILLVLHIKLADATLVGMGTDSLIWDALSHPDHALTARSLAHHLHDPSLVRIADGKGLTF